MPSGEDGPTPNTNGGGKIGTRFVAMRAKLGAVALFSLCSGIGTAANPPVPKRKIALSIPAGAPLRVYITRRVSKRLGAPVEGKLIEPLYAFDRQVVPAGTIVLGHVSRVAPVPGKQRAAAIMGGDFTPLHIAQVKFTTLVLPDGRHIALHTVSSTGSQAIFDPRAPKPKASPQTASNAGGGGVLANAKRKVRDQIDSRIANAESLPGTVRRADKKEMLYDFVMSKLPYHPQYWRKGTRFDPELSAPLSFGSEAVPLSTLARLGSQPPADSIVHARLITPLDSASSKLGETVEAMLVEPLFTPGHELLLPAGTRLDGAVVVTRRARWLHRSGQLRFNFRQIELPPDAVPPLDAGVVLKPVVGRRPPQERLQIRTEATLQAAESNGKSQLKVDSEGGVQTKESKTRFLAPAISLIIARSAADNDAGRARNGVAAGPRANVSGRTLGGASGFGIFGAAAAQSSPYVGTALGFYGLAWSVYDNVLARGGEVEFGRNAAIDIRFNTRTPAAASKFRAD